MPTTEQRRRFIPRAIRCFQSQTWENRELLILEDGPGSIHDLVPNDDRIRYVRCDAQDSLGNKRNLACSLTRSEYIAHWDDDDWSSPSRLAHQMTGHPTVASYNEMLFWDETRREAYRYDGGPKGSLGTSLLYRRDWWESHPFLPKHIGEDVEFSRQARKIMTVQAGLGMMVATTHSQGTSPRSMCNRWNRVDTASIPAEYWQL